MSGCWTSSWSTAIGEDEEYSAFLTVLDEEIGLPTAASLLGAPVTVTKLEYHDPARELIARCDGPHDSGDVALADLAFPADTVAAWLHAAYRHHLGLETFPAIPDPTGPGPTGTARVAVDLGLVSRRLPLTLDFPTRQDPRELE